MSYLDQAIIGIYFVIVLFIGVFLRKRAEGGVENYFLSGRKLPWWLAGFSMIATTFAADTPLAVTGLVAASGIAGNWFWWGYALSSMLTVFVFSRLWRRANVTTDAEFTELRYSGKGAAFLRVFRALYFAIPINTIIMGWVGLGMAKVINVAFDWPLWETFAALYVLTGVYIVLSGLWGVVVTDFVQFFLAIGGAVVVAIYSLDAVGGLRQLNIRFREHYDPDLLSVFGFGGEEQIVLMVASVWFFVQWWSAWFPGAEPGGGGYIAQRIFSVKNEREAQKSSLLFTLLHYVGRPWPWIIAAVASMVLYPDLDDKELGYPKLMVDYLPSGALGLVLVSFLAAFMSTLSTHISWGGSYLVSDIYRRFIAPGHDDSRYDLVSRVVSIALLLLSFGVTFFFDSVKGAWGLLVSIGAGTGLVFILRWFVPRINAWSEISAMGAALTGAIILRTLGVEPEQKIILLNTMFTTVVWVVVTFLTPPEPDQVWDNFVSRIGIMPRKLINRYSISAWLGGSGAIFIVTWGAGELFFGETMNGVIAILSGIVLFVVTSRFYFANAGEN